MKEAYLPPGVSVNTALGYVWTLGPDRKLKVYRRDMGQWLTPLVVLEYDGGPLDVPAVCVSVDRLAPAYDAAQRARKGPDYDTDSMDRNEHQQKGV